VPHASAYFLVQTEFRIQVPSTFKRCQIVVSANMLHADKDLRHSRATRPPRKRDRCGIVTIDTDFVEPNPPSHSAKTSRQYRKGKSALCRSLLLSYTSPYADYCMSKMGV